MKNRRIGPLLYSLLTFHYYIRVSGVENPTNPISRSTGEIEIFLKIAVLYTLSYTSYKFFIDLFVFLTSKKLIYPIAGSTGKVEIFRENRHADDSTS